MHAFLADSGGSDAETIAKALGTERTYVSRTLSKDPEVKRTYEGKRLIFRIGTGT